MKVGQKVEWVSSYKKKQGEVVAIVPMYSNNERKTGKDVFRDLKLEEKGFRFSAYGGGMPRIEESYLVALHEPNKKAGCLRQLYWPYKKQLKAIDSYK